jgi:hypothetical protein
MSGTAAADLEREEEASSAGLSARCAAQASSAFGEASPIPKMRSWRIVSSGCGPAAQCADTTQKGIGVQNGSNMSEVRYGNMPLARWNNVQELCLREG